MNESLSLCTWSSSRRLAAAAGLCAALLLSAFPVAEAQREAVKNTAGDASATKADPPAHSEAGKHGKTAKSAAAAPTKDIAADGAAKSGTGEGKGKEQTAYVFGLPTEDGKNLALSDYKGKVLLIVNLGRESTYASQLPALEKLSSSFRDKGLVVIGVPSNDFGAAEPGTAPEVAKYYTNAKVDFPVMQVSPLIGVHALPLFTYLTKAKAIPNNGLHWNYTKFLVDRKGNVVVRFPPEVEPDSLQMMATLQEVLDGTWKPKKPGGKADEAGGDGDDE
ncbi:MAG: glutathione peroxidase [Janthinobacterium lividum]